MRSLVSWALYHRFVDKSGRHTKGDSKVPSLEYCRQRHDRGERPSGHASSAGSRSNGGGNLPVDSHGANLSSFRRCKRMPAQNHATIGLYVLERTDDLVSSLLTTDVDFFSVLLYGAKSCRLLMFLSAKANRALMRIFPVDGRGIFCKHKITLFPR